ncbi:tRNA pseudouridine(55) synthase TruB [Streptococcus uberis]|uniref:tRNA pseudouridine(55) synthase TruB n=1 Tax=Streptococcus uberis TaxID=1349 RepID=UPI0021F200AC|nr:tRNA pseudouridine(55) synthase TruB [Streptococcus uberis]MCV6815746.1 tRNA pseudouridine(55) synthase TruB [Streptococcus uberis]MCZ8475123.1 tRNA pseudouridine(55) synthase TruB [Streptococcus uberis]
MKNGIINLYKEAGMTSHDAVFKLRRLLHEKKIGHGGTLDPDVSGVLPIAVGKATRVIEYMTNAGKVYEGTVTLGYSTTTEDSSGDIVLRTPVNRPLSEAEVDFAMKSFEGDIEQIPPMYSAVKVNGRKLYEYARAGQTVERPVRKVRIEQFIRTSDLTFKDTLCTFDFKVICSKGTYVRTLAVNLGEKLGFASHMSYLRRTASAGLTIDKSYTLNEIETLISQDKQDFLLPIEAGVEGLPKLVITDSEKSDIVHGRRVNLPSNEPTLAVFFEDSLVAILEKRDDSYKPKKVLVSNIEEQR